MCWAGVAVARILTATQMPEIGPATSGISTRIRRHFRQVDKTTFGILSPQPASQVSTGPTRGPVPGPIARGRTARLAFGRRWSTRLVAQEADGFRCSRIRLTKTRNSDSERPPRGGLSLWPAPLWPCGAGGHPRPSLCIGGSWRWSWRRGERLICKSAPFFSSAKSVLRLSMNAATPRPGRSSSIDMQAFRRDHWPRGASEIKRELRCPLKYDQSHCLCTRSRF
jgi:hypothetical protein